MTHNKDGCPYGWEGSSLRLFHYNTVEKDELLKGREVEQIKRERGRGREKGRERVGELEGDRGEREMRKRLIKRRRNRGGATSNIP